ncbi:MAG: oxygenase MpaB family protein [Gemmatimonadales bacterium]
MRYAQKIAFAGGAAAHDALERIRRTHAALEAARGQTIPTWAHRAVLYMLVAYSERAHTLLERPLTPTEQHDLYADFRRIGEGLGIAALPASYELWCVDRARQLAEDLAWSDQTAALFAAYRQQLGPCRYALLRHVQAVLVPCPLRRVLQLPDPKRLGPVVDAYRRLSATPLRAWTLRALIPRRYWVEVRQLDVRGCGRSAAEMLPSRAYLVERIQWIAKVPDCEPREASFGGHLSGDRLG